MEELILGVEVVFLVGLSAICSGLNISLMSLGKKDLERKAKLGSVDAKKILPLRANSHLSLASILLTNVAVISITSLVLGQKFGGLIAGIVSTLLIVIFGEVLPQALFARFALKFTAQFAWLLKIMTIITYPVSKPLQLVLDAILGHNDEALHNRTELGLILGDHVRNKSSELDEGEVKIMQAALGLSEKRVKEIMTPIEDVYWIANTETIDAAKVDEIKEKRWSRIPIFNKKLTTCYGILLMKDLVDVDLDNNPQAVTDLPLYSTSLVGSMTALDTMFRKFVTIHTHLVPIEKDDQIIGIITIEDLVEEILDHEIEDETDYAKKQSKRKKRKLKK